MEAVLKDTDKVVSENTHEYNHLSPFLTDKESSHILMANCPDALLISKLLRTSRSTRGFVVSFFWNESSKPLETVWYFKFTSSIKKIHTILSLTEAEASGELLMGKAGFSTRNGYGKAWLSKCVGSEILMKRIRIVSVIRHDFYSKVVQQPYPMDLVHAYDPDDNDMPSTMIHIVRMAPSFFPWFPIADVLALRYQDIERKKQLDRILKGSFIQEQQQQNKRKRLQEKFFLANKKKKNENISKSIK
jgi:hypothetical protein